MNKITLLMSVKKYGLFFIFFIFSFLTIENACSRRHWDPRSISIYYLEPNIINIICMFIEYEFGPNGEHAYLEYCNFKFTKDGKNYQKLFSCVGYDQAYGKTSWVYLIDKLNDANLEIKESIIPESGTPWPDNFNSRVLFKNFLGTKRSYFRIIWHLPKNIEIERFLIDGNWIVNGLYCSDNIVGNIYKLSKPANYLMNTDEVTDPKKKYVNETTVDLPKNNLVKVYKKADAVVLEGAELGEEVKIFTVSGSRINVTKVDCNVLKIKLPLNQIYIVNSGQTHYKIAL